MRRVFQNLKSMLVPAPFLWCGLRQSVDHRPKVVGLGPVPGLSSAFGGMACCHFSLSRLRYELAWRSRVPAAPASFLQLLACVLADRLEHPVALVGKRRRLFSTSDCSVSRSASRPPVRPRVCSRRRRPRARESRCSSSESRLIAPLDRRPQRLLPGIGSRPPRRRSSRSASRSRICLGESAFVRAAASSSASGRSSRRAQSSAISPRGSSRDVRRSDDGLGGGKRRDLVLDLALHAQALAACDEHVRLGQAVRSAEISGATSITCSRLSSRSSISRSPMCSASPFVDPIVWEIVAVTSEGSRSEARPTQKRPGLVGRGRAWRRPRARGGSCPTARPLSVTRRDPSSTSESTSASSAVRPDERLAGRGRFVFEIVLSGGNSLPRAGRSRLLPRCP